MRSYSLSAIGLVLAAALPAQDEGRTAAPAVLAPTVLAPETLARQFTEARNQWNRDLRAASAAKDAAATQRLRASRPRDAFVPRFEAGARATAGTEAAVPYLAWLVSHGPTEVASSSMATLMDAHIASPGIRLAVARIGGLKNALGVERSRQWLDRVLAHNADAHVLAQARFTRAALYVGTRAVATSPELRQQAIADLEAAQQALSKVEGGGSLQGLVERLLDEAQRLEPGCTAPEIEGQDLDGVTFKLSDYRGKVVLLDFWGDW